MSTTPLTVPQILSRIIAWFPMSGPVSRHGLGWGLEKGLGYDPLFDDYLIPLGHCGQTSYGIWLPFTYGNLEQAGQHFNLDAPSDLKELGLWHLVSDLAYHIRRHRRIFPHAECILYLGSIREPDFLRLAAERRFRAWFHRFYESLAPVIDEPNVHLCFDAWTGCDEHSASNRILQTVESLLLGAGRRTYTEGWPHRSRPDQARRPICVEDRHYLNSRPMDEAHHPGLARPQHNWATPSQSAGVEVIRIDQGAWDHKNSDASADALVQRTAAIVNHPSGLHRAAIVAYYVIGRGKRFSSAHEFATAVAATTQALPPTTPDDEASAT